PLAIAASSRFERRPQRGERQCVEVCSERYRCRPGVEYDSTAETIAGDFGECTQAVEVLRAHRGAGLDFDADHVTRTIFQYDIDFLTGALAEVIQSRFAAGPGRLFAQFCDYEGLQQRAAQAGLAGQSRRIQ